MLEEAANWAQLRAMDASAGPVSAVFFGGGSPSTLSVEQFEYVISHLHDLFSFTDNTEITVEWYPRPTDCDKLPGFVAAGANRISVGGQSFDERTLSALGSRHRPEDVRMTLRAALSAGVKTLNVDLMANVPGQSWESHENDLREAYENGVQSISVNSLEIASNTPFSASHPGLRIDDDVKREWLSRASQTIASRGFLSQRVRNFFKQGHLHRYNRMTSGISFDLIPLGPTAYGFVGGHATVNHRTFKDWKNAVKECGLSVYGSSPARESGSSDLRG